MAAKKKGKRKSASKRRRTKFKAITFKLSENQYRSLSNYCSARKTTPIKLIKKSLERYTSAYIIEVPERFYISSNQLDLFPEE